MNFEHAEGATPLNTEEEEGLRPTHIVTVQQLNEWEHLNILTAEEWVLSRRRSDILKDSFVRELHRRMFDKTWTWAGKYRRSDKNIGVPWPGIAEAVRNMCEDVRTWMKHDVFPPIETAVRLHLRSVQIHPFPNGNGRHARLLADALLHSLDHRQLSWGSVDLQLRGAVRERYISALKKADGGDVRPLLDFAVS